MHAALDLSFVFSTCMVDWCARGGLHAGESTDGDTGDTSVHTVVAERRTTNQPCGASERERPTLRLLAPGDRGPFEFSYTSDKLSLL